MKRLDLVDIRVVDALGEPVAEAFIENSRGFGRTDESGRISLPTPPDGMVLALAKGHGFSTLEMDSAEADSGGTYQIRLPAGNDLTIALGLDQAGLSAQSTTYLQIDLPTELLGAAKYGDRIALNFYRMAIGQEGHAVWFDWGVRLKLNGSSPPVVLPGLSPGARIP
ncbi:MAG: hypothetical protein GY888_03585, partial [Planctomycetaceae bacterium]|nr:hypothetical protein [Planctomycetaceae bacterium]